MDDSSRLLIDSKQFITLQSELAVIVGVNPAIALQKIHQWMDWNMRGGRLDHYFDDHWWVYNTWKEWKDKDFPFWADRTIRRVFRDLESAGLIVMRPHQNAKKGSWVTINYGTLESSASLQKRVIKVRRLQYISDTRVVKLTSQGGQVDQPASDTKEYKGRSKDSTDSNTKDSKIKDQGLPPSAVGEADDLDDAEKKPQNARIVLPAPITALPSLSLQGIDGADGPDRTASALIPTPVSVSPPPRVMWYNWQQQGIGVVLWNENVEYTAYIQTGDTNPASKSGSVDFVFSPLGKANELPEIIWHSLVSLIKNLRISTSKQRSAATFTSTNSEVLDIEDDMHQKLSVLIDMFSNEFAFSISLQVNRLTIWGGNVAFAISTTNNQLSSTLIVSFPEKKMESTWLEICKYFAPTATNAKPTISEPGANSYLSPSPSSPSHAWQVTDEQKAAYEQAAQEFETRLTDIDAWRVAVRHARHMKANDYGMSTKWIRFFQGASTPKDGADWIEHCIAYEGLTVTPAMIVGFTHWYKTVNPEPYERQNKAIPISRPTVRKNFEAFIADARFDRACEMGRVELTKLLGLNVPVDPMTAPLPRDVVEAALKEAKEKMFGVKHKP